MKNMAPMNNCPGVHGNLNLMPVYNGRVNNDSTGQNM